MNALGITFDSKLQWSKQVAKLILKSIKALHAICLNKPYFCSNELLSLMLYYNSDVWHLPLNPVLKNHLLDASSNA